MRPSASVRMLCALTQLCASSYSDIALCSYQPSPGSIYTRCLRTPYAMPGTDYALPMRYPVLTMHSLRDVHTDTGYLSSYRVATRSPVLTSAMPLVGYGWRCSKSAYGRQGGDEWHPTYRTMRLLCEEGVFAIALRVLGVSYPPFCAMPSGYAATRWHISSIPTSVIGLADSQEARHR
eukprot:960587-Rhodomonas_salina.1